MISWLFWHAVSIGIGIGIGAVLIKRPQWATQALEAGIAWVRKHVTG